MESKKSSTKVRLGIDRLTTSCSSLLAPYSKVGLITNQTGLSSDLVPSIDLIHKTGKLAALFGPEHGIRGYSIGGKAISGTAIDPITKVPVYSLYSTHTKPTPEMLSSVDALVYDIQDVGLRFYTYISTLYYCMLAAKENSKPFIVCDRPNPLGADIVEGPCMRKEFVSFIGILPDMPVRYGLTVGELALYMNQSINCELTIVEMERYSRKMTFRDTELYWKLPSPNIPTINTAFCYIGSCIFEGVNISEGRGTTKPFEFIGAPWIANKEELCEKLNSMGIPGVKYCCDEN